MSKQMVTRKRGPEGVQETLVSGPEESRQWGVTGGDTSAVSVESPRHREVRGEGRSWGH